MPDVCSDSAPASARCAAALRLQQCGGRGTDCRGGRCFAGSHHAARGRRMHGQM